MLRFRWWLAGIGAAIGLFALPALARTLGASAIAAAPNRGGVPSCGAPPDGASEIEIDSDGVPIRAWSFEPEGDARATVLVLHGIRDDKRSMLAWAPRLTRLGYRAVLVDLRGHGCSGGDWLTYGVRDAVDLSRVLDDLAPEHPVAVYGPSYGGAAALQLAARDPRVTTAVVISTFTSLRDVIPDYTRLYAGHIGELLPTSFYDRLLHEAGERAGVDLSQADSGDAIARVQAPVLILHAGADRHIPPRHARALDAAAPESELRILDDYDHDTIMRAPEVRAATLEWLDARLGE